jgi:ABC-type amino acid transport substrate-binding protein
MTYLATFKKIIGPIAATCMAFCFPAGASAQTVRIAVDQKFPPFVEVVDGVVRGLAVDLLNAAAQRAGLRIEYLPLPIEETQTVLLDGRADATYPLAINPARKETYDFSEALLSTGGGLFVRSPEKTPSNFSMLNGKTVVTPKSGPLAGYIQKNAPLVKLVTTVDYDESLAKLIAGEADAAALNLQVGAQLAAKTYPGKVTPADQFFLELPLAVAATKGQNWFLNRLNTGITQIRQDGTMKAITDKWTPR